MFSMHSRSPLSRGVRGALLIAALACTSWSPSEGTGQEDDRSVRIGVSRLYVGDSPVPVGTPIYDMRPGKDIRLTMWWSAPYEWDTRIRGGVGHKAPYRDKNRPKADSGEYEFEHRLDFASDSKEYPVDLKVTYSTTRIQSNKSVVRMQRIIRIEGDREFHALRSDDGDWLLLLRWEEEKQQP